MMAAKGMVSSIRVVVMCLQGHATAQVERGSRKPRRRNPGAIGNEQRMAKTVARQVCIDLMAVNTALAIFWHGAPTHSANDESQNGVCAVERGSMADGRINIEKPKAEKREDVGQREGIAIARQRGEAHSVIRTAL